MDRFFCRAFQIVLDVTIGLVLFIYLTGAQPFINDSLHALIQQKPWMHRLILTLITLLGILSGFALYFLKRNALIAKDLWLDVAKWGTDHPSVVVWGLFLVSSLVMSVSAITRHRVFHSSFDMAIFTQTVWNTMQGDWFYSSVKGGINLLADHFAPILALLAVPYRISPTPEFLLCLQAIAVFSSVFPLYGLAKHVLKIPSWALCFVLAFCLYLPVRSAVRFDFHPEVVTMPLLFLGFYLFALKRLGWASLCFFLALLSKENVPIVTFGIGFYACFFTSHRRFGTAWIIFSGLYFFLVTQIFMPALDRESINYLQANFFAWEEIGISALSKHLFNFSTIAYLAKIFLPVGFLSFLNPAVLVLTLPCLFQNLVLRNEIFRSIFHHYTALLTPFVFISAIYGLERLRFKRAGITVLLICSVLMSGVSEYYVMVQEASFYRPEFKTFEQIFAQIPSSASVRTHEFFAPHLANRKHLHIFENTHFREGGSEAALNSEYAILYQPLLHAPIESYRSSFLKSGYQLIREENGFHVFRKAQGGAVA